MENNVVIPAEAGIQSFLSSDRSEGFVRAEQFKRDLRAEFDQAIIEYGKPAVLRAIVSWMENQIRVETKK